MLWRETTYCPRNLVQFVQYSMDWIPVVEVAAPEHEIVVEHRPTVREGHLQSGLGIRFVAKFGSRALYREQRGIFYHSTE